MIKHTLPIKNLDSSCKLLNSHHTSDCPLSWRLTSFSLEGLGSRLVTDQGSFIQSATLHLHINHVHYPPPPPSSLPQSLISTWGNRLWRRDSSTDGSMFQSLPRLCVTQSSALRTSVSVKDSMNQVCTTWIVSKVGVAIGVAMMRMQSGWVKGQIDPRVPIPSFQLGLDFDHDIPELRWLKVGEVKQLWKVYSALQCRRTRQIEDGSCYDWRTRERPWVWCALFRI